MSAPPAPAAGALAPIHAAIAAMDRHLCEEPGQRCFTRVLACVYTPVCQNTLSVARDLVAHAAAVFDPVAAYVQHAYAPAPKRPPPRLAAGLRAALGALHDAPPPPVATWPTLFALVHAAERELALIWACLYVVPLSAALARTPGECWLVVVCQHNGFPALTSFEDEIPAVGLVFACSSSSAAVARQCVVRVSPPEPPAHPVDTAPPPTWDGVFDAGALRFLGACFLDPAAYRQAVRTASCVDAIPVLQRFRIAGSDKDDT